MNKRRIWNGLSALFSFMLCFSIIGTSCAMNYQGVVNGALGISTSKIVNLDDEQTDTQYYKSAYGELNGDNLRKLIADTYEQVITEAEEGVVLLTNEEGTLPLTSEESSVTLFGHAVVQPLYRNHSAGSAVYETEVGVDLYEALAESGFSINDTLFEAYQASPVKRGIAGFNFQTQETSEWSFGEEEISFYTDELQDSWSNDYNDIAIVMFAREGGEGAELYMEDPREGISQLALHQEEKDLLQMIKDSNKFEKTIVLINSGNPMELNWLDEYEIDACLWIGCPGVKGFEGVVNVLKGEVSPSGHLTDTYAVNSLSAPACVNNSYNNQTWTNLEEVLKLSTDTPEQASAYAAQAEGIYIGYKYYETRYEDIILNRFNADGTAGSSFEKAWNYAEEVSFPFGYGLSYTSFEQNLDEVEIGDDKITVQVTTTNTGDVAGKAVVQIYAQTPYGEYEQKNLVEKAAIQLLDFGKTKLLNPGESETITIECDKYLLASYDYLNAKGYILSEGDYYIAIGENSHDALNNVLAAKNAAGMIDHTGNSVSGSADKTYKWQEDFDSSKYSTSAYTGVVVTNQFEECDLNYWFEDGITYLSRQDWQNTYPQPVSVSLTEEMVNILNGKLYETPEDSQGISDYTQGDNQGIPLITMMGVDYEDNLWETFINQMTIEEMASLIADAFGTVEITSIGKPEAPAGDGPDGIGGKVSSFSEEKYGFSSMTCAYTSEGVLASTFNKDLIKKRGELMGEEGLFLGVMEVWAPGVNIHRTPFGGRNFEYYSEDANMNYLCAVPYVEAMQSKGVNAGPKHMAGNDQENNREGVVCFFNEQAFREGALRGVEGSVAVAGAHSVMQAFNRLGLVGCSLNTDLNTQVVRDEWGFVGHIETDAVAGATEGYKANYTSMLASGTDSFCLDFSGVSSGVIIEAINSNDDGTMLGHLRRAAKNILYCVVNSNVMNGTSANSQVVSITPWWQPVLYSTIALFSLLTLLSIAMLTKTKLQNNRKKDEKEA